MNFNLHKLAIIETIKRGFSTTGGNWETAFCQRCGKDLDGFYSFCNSCKRDGKLEKLLENDKDK